jgi:hypothetical protein
MDNKPEVKPSPPDAKNNDRCHGGSRQNNCNRYNNNNATPPGGKFRGKIKEITDDTFDNTGPNDVANFNKSLKNIAG